MIAANEFTEAYVEKTKQERAAWLTSEIASTIDHTIRNYTGKFGDPIHVRIQSFNVTEQMILDVLEKYKEQGWFVSEITPPGSYYHYEVWISTTPITKTNLQLWYDHQ